MVDLGGVKIGTDEVVTHHQCTVLVNETVIDPCTGCARTVCRPVEQIRQIGCCVTLARRALTGSTRLARRAVACPASVGHIQDNPKRFFVPLSPTNREATAYLDASSPSMPAEIQMPPCVAYPESESPKFRMRFIAPVVGAVAQSSQTATEAHLNAQALVQEVVENGLRQKNREQAHWSYREVVRKDGRLETRQVCQTNTGTIDRLVAINDQPLSAEQQRREEARVQTLLADPNEIRKERQKQRDDSARQWRSRVA